MSLQATAPDVEPIFEQGFDESEARSSSEELLSGTYRSTLTLQQDQPVGEESFSSDPFKPFKLNGPEEHHILTFRAVLVGSLFGAVANASNIYLGLKAGWTTSANIFGSIGGFAVIKACSTRFPGSFFLGGTFGPQENNIAQTAATAAGGLSSVFVSAIPAMYQLGLLTTPPKDFFRILTLTATGGYFGLLFAAPLRQSFILTLAKDLNLTFPSSTATAVTIKSMHEAADGSSSAWRTMKALGLAFVFAAGLRILSQYAIGILWDWHIFTWLASAGILYDTAIAIESWGWLIEWTPAFIGSGILVGTNVAVSFLTGSILAWGIIGPYLVSHGLAFGTPASSDPQWQGLMSYFSLSREFASLDHPSPRYWLLWPGVACMITVAFTELALQWRMFWALGRDLFSVMKKSVSGLRKDRHEYEPVTLGSTNITKIKGEMQYWMWLPGLIVVIVLICIITKFQYDMSVLETLLALLLGSILSLIAIQATGATDTTPLTTVSKTTQLVLGATTRNTATSQQAAQRLNLLGGALASVGANQACDLIGDFRVGHLLTTPPNLQYLTQLIGTTLAIIVAPTIFLMFANAYPCILSAENSNNCPFSAPAASSWRAVAVAATADTLPLPPPSARFSVFMAALGIASVLVKQYLWCGRWERVKNYHPNLMIIGLAFTLPATQYGTAMLIGALVAQGWKKRNPKTFETYSYAVAAGLMAGEGIGGALNAIIAVVGLGGDDWGTSVGCPARSC